MRTRERLGIATLAAAGHALVFGYLATARDDAATPDPPPMSVRLVTLTPPPDPPPGPPPPRLRTRQPPRTPLADPTEQPPIPRPNGAEASSEAGRWILSVPEGRGTPAPGPTAREACEREWAKLGYPGVAPCPHRALADQPGAGYVADADRANAPFASEIRRKEAMERYRQNPAYYPGLRCAVFHRC